MEENVRSLVLALAKDFTTKATLPFDDSLLGQEDTCYISAQGWRNESTPGWSYHRTSSPAVKAERRRLLKRLVQLLKLEQIKNEQLLSRTTK